MSIIISSQDINNLVFGTIRLSTNLLVSVKNREVVRSEIPRIGKQVLV